MANIPALVIGAAASAAVSMASGLVIGSYATAGMLPGDTAAPRIVKTQPWSPSPEAWPPAELADPLGRYATTRASGSSRL